MRNPTPLELKKRKTQLTRGQGNLLVEMAQKKCHILIQPHPQEWVGFKYTLMTFPMRRLSQEMVAKLNRLGYLELSPRGFYRISVKGRLQASVIYEARREV